MYHRYLTFWKLDNESLVWLMQVVAGAMLFVLLLVAVGFVGDTHHMTGSRIVTYAVLYGAIGLPFIVMVTYAMVRNEGWADPLSVYVIWLTWPLYAVIFLLCGRKGDRLKAYGLKLKANRPSYRDWESDRESFVNWLSEVVEILSPT